MKITALYSKWCQRLACGLMTLVWSLSSRDIWQMMAVKVSATVKVLTYKEHP